MNQRQILEQKITDLMASLSSSASRIGDWAVIKCLEYKDAGQPAPYDLESIEQQRQAVRDQINELQAQLENLPQEEVEA